jgi:hypothetical protein
MIHWYYSNIPLPYTLDGRTQLAITWFDYESGSSSVVVVKTHDIWMSVLGAVKAVCPLKK